MGLGASSRAEFRSGPDHDAQGESGSGTELRSDRCEAALCRGAEVVAQGARSCWRGLVAQSGMAEMGGETRRDFAQAERICRSASNDFPHLSCTVFSYP